MERSRSLRKQHRDNLPRENIALCFAREYYYIQAGIIQQDEDAEWRNWYRRIVRGGRLTVGKRRERNGERTVLCAMHNNRERTLRRLWLFLLVDHFFFAAGLSSSFQSCTLTVATHRRHTALARQPSNEEIIYSLAKYLKTRVPWSANVIECHR